MENMLFLEEDRAYYLFEQKYLFLKVYWLVDYVINCIVT